ncbi:hypothetical protein Goarm_020672 [Gossypium armourianum]|uniref:Transmembrane protein 50A n=1 Tax=Gossypium armourianum TaxID=34283 RepID=A0A7J9IPE8_9ROSI|nr:hypothetical protein [Gossypium armourianum]
MWAIFSPGVAGAVFGAGWWFWVDAVVCSSVNISFVHYLPGIFASIAALMFNCVRKDDIDYSPYDEGEWSVLMVNSLLLTHSTVAEAVHDSAVNLEILLAAYMALRN